MPKIIGFTISPPFRQLEHFLTNPNLAIYEDDVLFIRQVFEYNKFKHYMIYPEFDPKGRLHYHGNIHLDYNEEVRWYKHANPKLTKLGHVLLTIVKNKIDHQLFWLNYMRKDWPITKEILDITMPIMPSRSQRRYELLKSIKINNKKNSSQSISLLDYFPSDTTFNITEMPEIHFL